MGKQEKATLCNQLLHELVAAPESLYISIASLARYINVSAGITRKCVQHMLHVKPEWFANADYSIFGIRSVMLNYKSINEIRYFLSQHGFCESPLFLALA
jgi:hypothetical protein